MSKANAECGVRSAELRKKPVLLASGGPIRALADIPGQLLELRQERDLARSERDLMERMYHGGLGTMENYMKLNRALTDWQQLNMPAVRAVREILSQRPDLKGPDGIVNAILKGSQPSNQVTKGIPESVCVGEFGNHQGGGPVLRCGNCGDVVAAMSKEQFQELQCPGLERLRVLWAMPWAEHIARKCARPGAVQASARPAEERDRLAGIAELDADGAHGVTRPTTEEKR